VLCGPSSTLDLTLVPTLNPQPQLLPQIVNPDINPNPAVQLDNVLLDGQQPRPNIKLCDFGYSKDEVTQSVCKTACGTPEYMSPEVSVPASV